VRAEIRRQQSMPAEKMPRVPADPIPDKEPLRRASDSPAKALPLRHFPGRVNCTAVLDGLRRIPQRPPEHVRTPGMRSLLPGPLHQPGPRDLKG
jgi:hypothetical protein